jgi:hypothetical protein
MKILRLLSILTGFSLGTLLLTAAFLLSFEPVQLSGSMVLAGCSMCSPLDTPIGRFLLMLSLIMYLVTALIYFLGSKKLAKNERVSTLN